MCRTKKEAETKITIKTIADFSKPKNLPPKENPCRLKEEIHHLSGVYQIEEEEFKRFRNIFQIQQLVQ